MCKKLSIFCIALLVVVLSIPALAEPTLANPLLIDLNGDTNSTQAPGRTQPGWQNWNIGFSDGITATSKSFSGLAAVTIGAHQYTGANSNLDGRNRTSMSAGNYGMLHNELFFVRHSALDLAKNGMDFIQLDFNFGSANAGKTFEFTIWAWDKAFDYSGEPAGSKNVAYTTIDPAQWLIDNNMPIGYDYNQPMPAGLASQVLGMNPCMGMDPQTPPGGPYVNSSTFDVTADGTGKIRIYEFSHQTSWTGSQHIPINAIKVIPEPTTVALLGLGGLSLLRRRKR